MIIESKRFLAVYDLASFMCQNFCRELYCLDGVADTNMTRELNFNGFMSTETFEFLCPRDDSQGALRFAPVRPSVCPSVHLSVRPFVTLYGIEFV